MRLVGAREPIAIARLIRRQPEIAGNRRPLGGPQPPLSIDALFANVDDDIQTGDRQRRTKNDRQFVGIQRTEVQILQLNPELGPTENRRANRKDVCSPRLVEPRGLTEQSLQQG